LERRSKHRNAQKAPVRYEDDLLTPAAAINPNDDDVSPSQAGGGGNAGSRNAGGGGGNAKNRKKGKKDKSRGQDANHLLGFNVTAGERVNAGEFDLPQ
jgi:hypothetical protein